MIKFLSNSRFRLFECWKVVAGAKSPDPGNGTYLSCFTFYPLR